MLLEHERSYGLGMDAPVTVCSWNTIATRPTAPSGRDYYYYYYYYHYYYYYS